MALARLLETRAGAALRLARLGVGLCGETRGLARRVQFFRQRIGLGARGGRLGAKIHEAVLLGEAPRGGGRRLGRLCEAVPAPQIAFLGDEPLAGLQQLAQALALGAQHDADLREAAAQRRRRLDELPERAHAIRQRGIALARRQRPMRRRGIVGRGVEIVAERGAERRLIALFDRHAFDDRRPKAAGARLQQILKRARFRLQPLRAQRRLLQRRAGGGLGFARLAVRRFGLMRRLFRRAPLFGGGLEDLREARHFLRAAALPGDQREFGLDAGEFGFESRDALILLAQRGL